MISCNIKKISYADLRSCNEGIAKLFDIMQKHPNLPVIPMVDSEIIQDDCFQFWSAKFGSSPHISKICAHDERLVIWDEYTPIQDTFEDLGYDYDECGIKDGMSEEEARRIMEEKISEHTWLLCIVAPITIPDPIFPESRSPEPEGTTWERLQERIKKYEATKRTEEG